MTAQSEDVAQADALVRGAHARAYRYPESFEGFRGVLGVERPEDEMAGFRGGQGDPRGFRVAQFADEDDVGILPEHVFQGGGERGGVDGDLALIDEGQLVLVKHLLPLQEYSNLIFVIVPSILKLIVHRGL